MIFICDYGSKTIFLRNIIRNNFQITISNEIQVTFIKHPLSLHISFGCLGQQLEDQNKKMFQGKKDMKYCTYVDGYMQIYKVFTSTSKSSQYQNVNIILNNNLIPNIEYGNFLL